MNSGLARLHSELTRRSLMACGLAAAQRVVPFRGDDPGMMAAGSLIGTIIKTASSGARLELDSTNGLRLYDSGGNLLLQIPIGQYIRLASLVALGGSNLTIQPETGSDVSLTLQAPSGGYGKLAVQGAPYVDSDLILEPWVGGLVRYGGYTAGAPTPNGYISQKLASGDVIQVPVYKP